MSLPDHTSEDTWPVLRLFEPPAALVVRPLVEAEGGPSPTPLTPRLVEAILQCAPEGIALLEAREGAGPRLVFVNDAFCLMTRVTREEALAQAPCLLGASAAD